MIQKSHLHQYFKKELFWDVDLARLDQEKDKRIIIERVSSLGNLKEFRHLIQLYNKPTIVSQIRQIGYFDPKTVNFLIEIFNLKKEDFKCYTKKQSQRIHWD